MEEGKRRRGRRRRREGSEGYAPIPVVGATKSHRQRLFWLRLRCRDCLSFGWLVGDSAVPRLAHGNIRNRKQRHKLSTHKRIQQRRGRTNKHENGHDQSGQTLIVPPVPIITRRMLSRRSLFCIREMDCGARIQVLSPIAVSDESVFRPQSTNHDPQSTRLTLFSPFRCRSLWFAS